MNLNAEAPETVLAEALARLDAPDAATAERAAVLVLTAMPDHTIVRRSELEALRDVVEAARAFFAPGDNLEGLTELRYDFEQALSSLDSHLSRNQ